MEIRSNTNTPETQELERMIELIMKKMEESSINTQRIITKNIENGLSEYSKQDMFQK